MFVYLVEKYYLIMMISTTNRCIAQKQAKPPPSSSLMLFGLQHNRNDRTEMFTNISMMMNKQKGEMNCAQQTDAAQCSSVEKMEK